MAGVGKPPPATTRRPTVVASNSSNPLYSSAVFSTDAYDPWYIGVRRMTPSASRSRRRSAGASPASGCSGSNAGSTTSSRPRWRRVSAVR